MFISFQVYYIRAPGNYTIDFKKITVKVSTVTNPINPQAVYWQRSPLKSSVVRATWSCYKHRYFQEDFGHLAGEIGITLQVPIIEGPAGERIQKSLEYCSQVL